MKHRPQRVGSLIQEKLAEIMVREMEFSGALVTITGVDVAKDLENAAVSFSVFPSDKSEKILGILNKFQGRLQYLLMKKISIKPMPRIHFRIDYGPENAATVEKALLEHSD